MDKELIEHSFIFNVILFVIGLQGHNQEWTKRGLNDSEKQVSNYNHMVKSSHILSKVGYVVYYNRIIELELFRKGKDMNDDCRENEFQPGDLRQNPMISKSTQESE